ncbi:LuxR C-terminal-related transcriptional regulator [Ornithinimicrobium cavernae]|uniref:LuxR C-terminal-related transcriptional regulator n=1 Tax=Ornithinimicrobium cavernae TaxID=2666047 RepID=UPI000D696A0D|nr:LuxR C-terminal-related transcriptional regulator [Ornithinimicrobium cavernae]
MSLRAAGLDPSDEELYRLLVRAVETDLVHLAELADRPVQDTEATVLRLRDQGLATVVESDPLRIAAAPPDVAFAPLLLRGRQALTEATLAVTELAEEHRANARRRDAGQLVEVVHGAAGIRQALRTVQLSTREEMLWFCKAGHVAMASGENDEEYVGLARGVRYRVIYEQAMLDDPTMLVNVARGVRAGEEARAAPNLPVRLAIADRSLALCPLITNREGHDEPTAALVRDSNLLTALIALFDVYWSDASPLHVAGLGDRVTVTSPPSALGPEELELLSLLVAGVTDKAIATRLGVSLRTVQRRISELMALAGAETRMQLAWQVAQRGWLTQD